MVTFDPGPALRTIALELPDALYAVEDLGLGLPGVRRLPRRRAVAGDLEVVSLRGADARRPPPAWSSAAPSSTPEEFHELVERVGLHEVDVRGRLVGVARPRPRAGCPRPARWRRSGSTSACSRTRPWRSATAATTCEMLRWAARGVAMGHAPEAVRAAADEVTGTIDDDGASPSCAACSASPGAPRPRDRERFWRARRDSSHGSVSRVAVERSAVEAGVSASGA